MGRCGNNLKMPPRDSFFTPLAFTPLDYPSNAELELTVWPIECGGSMFLLRLDNERHFCFSLDLLTPASQGKPATMLEGYSIALWRNPCGRQQKTLLTAVPHRQTHKWATILSQSSLQMAPQPISDSRESASRGSLSENCPVDTPEFLTHRNCLETSHYCSLKCLILGVICYRAVDD